MHDSPVLGLREAKKAETRRRLSDAARGLALERGLDAVTVEQVCGEAGVSVRTFFNYFESKEAAVLGDEPPLGTPSSRAEFLADGPSGDLLADVLVLLDPSAALEHEGRERLLLGLQLAQREPRVLAAHVTRQMAHEQDVAELVAQRRGLPAPDAGCRALAAAAHALVRTACRAWFEDDAGRPLRHHLDQARAALAGALDRTP